MSTKHVSVRLDDETLVRVDSLTTRFSTEWHAATRSDVLRALINTALEIFEREPEPSPPGGSPSGGAAPAEGGQGRQPIGSRSGQRRRPRRSRGGRRPRRTPGGSGR